MKLVVTKLPPRFKTNSHDIQTSRYTMQRENISKLYTIEL